ncbi:tRNA lysidine(34) synthetase TilS [Ferrimonas lipolytica]|uniref:tRNA(Ile)-lysidine synthase n=1 Tax=Ferrimonas lipolytica TaxID=2724191 RepID=A0A6H1UEX1_9GAMM|nr:tRNA lysidine(34) synthetase TilS [Ferrimonas lipolytica]QIZ77378.1 tRNA lysidine(34) synthetase TilS [Ferrimonas lipolytica]
MPLTDSTARLEAALFSALQHATAVTVGYSGGVDSSLLAHLVSRWHQQHPQISCRLIHVHHGLSHNADDWLAHCAQQAQQLNLSFEAHRVTLELGARISIEAAARRARYQVFMDALAVGEVLLTGHHLDDQAETLLLALKRGSGPTGLAAMSASQPLGRGLLVRPWLNCRRADIEVAASELMLNHIDDDSNQDDRFDRNFLRNQVLPLLSQRWPAIHSNIARSAELCAEQQALCDEVAQSDYQQCRLPASGLDLDCSRDYSQARKNNLLRYFLRQHGTLMPSKIQLQQLQQMWNAREDSQPQLDWGQWSLRRYLNGVYLLSNQPPELLSTHDWSDGKLQNGQHWLLKPCYNGVRLRPARTDEQISIRYQLPGSTKLQPSERDKRRSLKKLWQEYRVPPWQRSQVAMLCYNNIVVAALGYWIERDYLCDQGEGWSPQQLSDWLP